MDNVGDGLLDVVRKALLFVRSPFILYEFLEILR